jgi:hypothetical protein
MNQATHTDWTPGVQDPSALPMQRARTSKRPICIPLRAPEELLDVSTRLAPSLLQILGISNLGSIWARSRSGMTLESPSEPSRRVQKSRSTGGSIWKFDFRLCSFPFGAVHMFDFLKE